MQGRLIYRLTRAERLARSDAARKDAEVDPAFERALNALRDVLGDPPTEGMADLHRRLQLGAATGAEIAAILEVERTHAADWRAVGLSPRDLLGIFARISDDFLSG